GVMTAIYLEEFAPDNRLTQVIEVNINNLAAIPSILYGLLGLAIFINFMGVPRSSALVGGLTLALMTLPVIIIATRAALRSVPDSIREAAYGVGASSLQTVWHHVLPLAMPGILTGSIIGLAQAMGETAPLLIVGMMAYIPDAPGSIFEATTVLPAQIYTWSSESLRAFEERTAAGIMVLLAVLLTLNALAVKFRNRSENTW
ncbi:MAG TPA: phosphate ABC transporter permease PstA, partial [Mariprofundaceae bacterium]|nr:phosphate ABC transporter permease PstA [Mariprofundaceae bacterium]